MNTKEKRGINYRIGLDLGIASVGWAVLAHDSNEEVCKILARGVRCFDVPEKDKDKGSLMAERRMLRSARRRLRRKKLRTHRIKTLVVQELGFQFDELDIILSSNPKSVYEIRYEALTRKLSKDEWARLLVHLGQRRGFKSNKKSDERKKEAGLLLKAVGENQRIMDEKGYKTVGELLYKEFIKEEQNENAVKRLIINTRNKEKDYKLTVSRESMVREIELLFELQKDLGNSCSDERFKHEYLNIFTAQRGFEEGPGKNSYYQKGDGSNLIEAMVGSCTLFPSEKRAPKSSYSFERFVLLNNINNTKIMTPKGLRVFTEEERGKLIKHAYDKGKLSYEDVRKILGFKLASEEGAQVFDRLNYYQKAKNKEGKFEPLAADEIEKKEMFANLKFCVAIKKVLGANIVEFTPEQLDDIGYIFTFNKSDAKIREALLEKGFSAEVVEKLEKLESFDKVGHLSFGALRALMPFLEQAYTYDKACELVTGESKEVKTRNIKLKFSDVENEMLSPVAKRTVSQAFKVVNAIIEELGSPQLICLEFGRELAKTARERNELETKYKTNQAENSRILTYLKDELQLIDPRGNDIVKYKLWQEQQGICAYSLKKIPIEELFSDNNTEIDHIIPYSISFDDGYRNKVIVYKEENQKKGNRTPLEYFGYNESKADEFRTWVRAFIRNKYKAANLLATEFNQEEFIRRNLHDTQTSSKVVASYLRDNLLFKDSKNHKNKVVAVNGAITSYVRNNLGLKKDRDDDKHHAEDAIIIAACTQGLINKITNYEKAKREYAFDKKTKTYISKMTGEVFDSYGAFKVSNKERRYQLLEFWDGFRDEFLMWFSARPNDEEWKLKRARNLPMYSEEECIEPLFISRMPTRKVTGEVHEATIRGHVQQGNEHYMISRKPITSLSIKDGEISGYFRKEDDILLYDALKVRLLEYDGKGEKAFAEPFYKPLPDNRTGEIVKKVKVFEKTTKFVELGGVGGIAKNSSMVRLDVFEHTKKNKKLYSFVPIYAGDFCRTELPNKAYPGAVEMTDEYKFIFSLFPNDLLYIENDSVFKGINRNKEIEEFNQGFFYYKSFDISVAALMLATHNSVYKIRLGGKTLKQLQKCEVSVLGDKRIISKSEKRNLKTFVRVKK